MATTTSSIDFAGSVTSGAEKSAPKRGFFGRLLDGFTAGQMRRAQVHVQSYLVQLSDERLSDLGFTPDEAKAIRQKGSIPASYWG